MRNVRSTSIGDVATATRIARSVSSRRISFSPRYAHTTNLFVLKLFQELHSVVSQKSITEHFTTSIMRIRRVLDAVV